MEMEKGTLIFSEQPYAAVFYKKYWEKYCANCFDNIPVSVLGLQPFYCRKGCIFAYYCDDNCRKEDWPWHQFECAAFNQRKQEIQKMIFGWKAMDLANCRFVGRMVARFRQDPDASLAEGLPNGVKHRKLGDMKCHHYADVKNNRKDWKKLQKACKQFFEFFASTELNDTSTKTVRIFFCISRIYAIRLYFHCGFALYPNCTRFNHSCNPTAFRIREGRLLQTWANENVHPDEYSTENRLNQLTIDYLTVYYDSGRLNLHMTRNRVDRLKRGYFRCLCSACVDSKATLIEERAAVHECGECGTPYIWTEKGRLQQMCKCKQSVPDTSPEQKREALKLEKEWNKIMQRTDPPAPARTVISLCEPFVEKAKKLWHHTENLRLGVMVHRLGVAYKELHLYRDVDLSERECQRRIECLYAVADYYERRYWAHSWAQSAREWAKSWEQRCAKMKAAKEEPFDAA